MATTVGFAELRVPSDGDAFNLPSDMANLATDVDARLVHLVADAAERDVRLSDADPGTVAASTVTGTVWFLTSEEWVTWWEPEGDWRSLTLGSGVTSAGQSPEIKRTGVHVELRGNVQSSGDGSFPTGQTEIGTVPSDCIPLHTVSLAVGASTSGATTVGAARMDIRGNDSSSSGTIYIFTQEDIGGFVSVYGMWSTD
ncbi:MAG: hypothetical protein ACRDQA_12470 [Nocardioidaceae bacterium]